MSASKRLQEKLRKEEQEAAHVFQDFIETFQNVQPTQPKTFVRSGTLYSEQHDPEKNGQIYNPKPLIKLNKTTEVSNALECAKILKPFTLEKSKKTEKPKSNLQQLKEELKQKHSEKSAKLKLKEGLEFAVPSTSSNFFETPDPNSTNLFITNLNPKVTENHLMMEFGVYGPLASVKIMWPRHDDKSRVTNCGFVAFMSRKDAERALQENKHREDIKIGWGKAVEIPQYPIYVPNELLKLYLPPPLTGLPFNAQPPDPNWTAPVEESEFEDFLKTCYIKVTIPLNKKLLMIVHRMVEFVVREGPMFEAFIMNKEIKNPDYNFLFDCQSPIHVYYRWKIFSILNGDAQKSWLMKPFRMFKGGSIWLPPVAPNYTDGMPEELIKRNNRSNNKLTESQLKRLSTLLRKISMNRAQISEAMLFCLNHRDALDDSIDIIMESLMDQHTNPLQKIARLYLLSDVLSNLKIRKVHDVLGFGKYDKKLIHILKILKRGYDILKFESDKCNYMQRILKVIEHWENSGVIMPSSIKRIEEIFPKLPKNELEDDNSSIDEPLDGASLLKRSLESDIGPEVVTSANFDNESKKSKEENIMSQYFIPSKWDTVDPEEVESQAVSTEEIYYMEKEKKKHDKRMKRSSSKKKKKHH